MRFSDLNSMEKKVITSNLNEISKLMFKPLMRLEKRLNGYLIISDIDDIVSIIPNNKVKNSTDLVLEIDSIRNKITLFS